ncbi:MAG: PH domain-containing protein [Bradyrhizobiaceae bacterium]|nr:MAG: PH domain-containing protein [Bradyrhizobiaceae bacterium]
MARYVDSILQPGEKLLYSTTLHGIIYLPGMLCFAAGAACLAGFAAFPPLLVGAALFAVIGFMLALRAWFKRWTTETDVTTMRVVHKEGFIQRRTFEMSLDKVESVDVDQSVWGRLFGWGDVTIRGVGEGAKTIRMIASPIEFRNHITAR